MGVVLDEVMAMMASTMEALQLRPPSSQIIPWRKFIRTDCRYSFSNDNLELITDLGDEGGDMMLHEVAHAGLDAILEEGGHGQRGDEPAGVIDEVLEVQVAGSQRNLSFLRQFKSHLQILKKNS